MGSFDQDKDRLVKQFEVCDEEGKCLLFSIMKYADGDPKLQIHRMFPKRDGTVGYGKAGRLTKDEVEFFKNNMDEILRYMV